MYIRSKHGAITAWCATVVDISSKPTHDNFPRTQNRSLHLSYISQSDSRVFSSSDSFSICRSILICLLLLAEVSALVTALPSTTLDRQSMLVNPIGSSLHRPRYSSPFFPTPKQSFKRRIKRQIRDRHPWTSDLVTLVCDKLVDPCIRASFLRRHAELDICSDIPPLYLLPYIDVDVIEGKDQSSTQLCNSKEKGVRSSDGLYRKYLETPDRCRQSLEALDAKLRSTLNPDLDAFMDILERSFCILANGTDNTMQEECVQCRKAYWSWVCSVKFPIYYPLVELPTRGGKEEHVTDAPIPYSSISTATTTSSDSSSIINVTTSQAFLRNISTQHRSTPRLKDLLLQRDGGDSTLVLERVPACITWCTSVETLCPYFNPSDATSNGGEPTFLCDESHYQYAPPDSLQLLDFCNNCEHGCCYTKLDLEMDDDSTSSDISTYSSMPSSSSADLKSAAEALSESAVEALFWNMELSKGESSGAVKKKYISLRERCFQQQLFKSSEGSECPLKGDRSPSSLSSSAVLPNAFLIVTITALLC